MFLSIVIPHYNLPKQLLERCLQSIAQQCMPEEEYEVIVVDDGSDDAPAWILDTFKALPLKLIPAEHKGLSETRNRGIYEAAGKYIMFLDSDDSLQPNSIQPCIETLRNECPQILRYQHKVCKKEKDFLPSKKKKYKTSNTISGAKYMEESNLFGSACLYFFKKEIVARHNIRFIPGIYHEDEDFTTRLHYHATSLIYCNAVIYNYCIRENSIITGLDEEKREKHIADHLKILKGLVTFRSENAAHCDIQARGLNRKIATLTVDYIIKLVRYDKSTKEIEDICKRELAPLGLYPLPKESFSFKYIIFSKLANSFIGLLILRILLLFRK